MTDIRIVATNTSAQGGTFLTPFWFAAHDGSFDLYNRGEAASAGLEALAEDGNFAPINAEVAALDSDAQTGAVLGGGGPLATGETGVAKLDVDGASNGFISLAAMLLPSNDAFVGTGQAVQLFDEEGNFLGAQNLEFEGSDVLDAGTEENTEEDAAFLNQTAPDTGVDENGVVTLHEGFLPEGEGNILGGTNAAGAFIDPEAADFTRPGAQIAQIHINEYTETEGTDGFDFIRGSRADDLVEAGGGRDIVLGRGGWDELSGGAGRDLLNGGSGNDTLDGGSGRDLLKGGSGSDVLEGGDGRDVLLGGSGNDTLDGGSGRDLLKGGGGADTFVFEDGDGRDRLLQFDADEDVIALNVEGADSFQDLEGFAREHGNRTVLNFGDGDALVFLGVEFDELSAANFDFL
ncbi:spondin domain-containing protein [Leisingera sp. ANG-M1]|uniref:spondin domain-containing protein n=1 Tax=Leisingera sp. ANG-M1 TaxID=1577895 RepID=UPI00068E3175|nr:spondin domain-containing protein [Leisingera sp. ANG-M1]